MKNPQLLLRPSFAILGLLIATHLTAPAYAVDDDDELSEKAKKELMSGTGPKELTPTELKKLKEGLNGPVDDAPDIHVATALTWTEDNSNEKINTPAVWNPLFEKARAGDADSLYLVGLCYAKGHPIPQDLNKAFRSFFPAAQKGHLEAKFLAARCLDLKVVKLSPEEEKVITNILMHFYAGAAKEGHPLANYYYAGFLDSVLNSDSAIKYITIAAEKGYAPAQYDLALRIRKGEDYRFGAKQTHKLLKIAAEQGYARAQYELGRCQANGLHGIPKNPVEAYAWLSTAIANGLPDEAKALIILKTQLSPADLETATQKAAEFSAKFKSPVPSKNPLL